MHTSHATTSMQSQTEFLALLTDELSDESLIGALVGGADWAMERLYQRYSRRLYFLAYRIVADHQIAEDLLQEVFLAVWQHARSYSPQAGSVPAWLFSIMHHRALDYIRSVRCRSLWKQVSWEEVEQDERMALPDVWEQVWCAVQSAKVRECLMKLPAEQCLVIELAYFRGWTHLEIAEYCRIPCGTIKSRMRLGLLHLKRELSAAQALETVDSVETWLEECCDLEAAAWTAKEALIASYCAWCEQRHLEPKGTRMLGVSLQRCGIVPKRQYCAVDGTLKRMRGFSGLSIC